jgi:Protein of unknown function (DUF3662)/FHA domain
MALQGIEKRLERLVEGAFARAFRSELRPVELGRKIIREVDANLTIGVKGERVAPNHFRVQLAEADLQRFVPFSETLVKELADAVEEHCAHERYQLKGPTTVDLISNPSQRAGQFSVTTAIAVAPRNARASAWVQTPDGTKHAILDGDPLSIGRVPDCDIVINNTNVSRRHAEIRLIDGKVSIVDLQSLNGTRVNGRGIPPDAFGTPLHDGDLIQIGDMVIRFVVTRKPTVTTDRTGI